MATSTTDVYLEEKREKATIRYADMSFILPLSPGDVRDADDRLPGGPEPPVHPNAAILPRFAVVFHWCDVSSAVESAAEAPR